MIPRTLHLVEEQSWQEQLINAISSVEELLSLLSLEAADVGYSPSADQSFALRVPLSYIKKIQPGDADDPLLKQVLPINAEDKSVPGYILDPLAEDSFKAHKGMIQKYRSRALLVATSSCAINCRYCFRRHFPYQENRLSKQDWTQAFAQIAADTAVDEVILSGGEPMLLKDSTLAMIFDQLAEIPHLKTVRIHSRMIATIADRVTPALLTLIKQTPLRVVAVSHINHAQEIDQALINQMTKLRESGAHLLNQSVLLRGVNDDSETLCQLSQRLFSAQILPYYLHQLDPVQGAAHFQVDDARALLLIDQMRQQLAGYLVPKLVREVPGAPSKTPIV